MPDTPAHPHPDAPSPELTESGASIRDDLIQAGLGALRQKCDEDHPHVFDEIAVFASAFHKAISALDPIVNLPTRNPRINHFPLAPSPATEGYGANMARELVQGIKNLASPQTPRQSTQDLIRAIALAKEEGLEDELAFLRKELYGTAGETEDDEDLDEDLSPTEKVERANELIAQSRALTSRGSALLESIDPQQVDEER